MGVDFRLPQYAEAVCETDAGMVAFTAGAAFGDVFNKDVRLLAVKTAKGGGFKEDDLPNALWGAATAFLPNATPFYARLWERMSILRFSSIVFRERT